MTNALQRTTASSVTDCTPCSACESSLQLLARPVFKPPNECPTPALKRFVLKRHKNATKKQNQERDGKALRNETLALFSMEGR